jgi:hypothetical protein
VLGVDRHDGHIVRRRTIERVADVQHGLFARGSVEEAVEVVAPVEFAAVDREEVFAFWMLMPGSVSGAVSDGVQFCPL